LSKKVPPGAGSGLFPD